jgi:FkbM family methyltransferase
MWKVSRLPAKAPDRSHGAKFQNRALLASLFIIVCCIFSPALSPFLPDRPIPTDLPKGNSSAGLDTIFPAFSACHHSRSINCEKYTKSRDPYWIFDGFIRRLSRTHSNPHTAARFVKKFFEHYPIRPDSQPTSEVVEESLLAALLCNKMWLPLPSITLAILNHCRTRQSEFRSRHKGIKKFNQEVFCASHLLEMLDRRVIDYIRPRAALDIGAWVGDSALVFMDYTKDVYSFEPTLEGFNALEKTIGLNPGRFGTGHAVRLALSDTVQISRFQDGANEAASMRGAGGSPVNVTTLDKWMEGKNVSVGVVKCDTEGHGWKVINGAAKTLAKHRPLLLLSVYHCPEEFFGIRQRLGDILSNYEYGMEFGCNAAPKFHELSLIGIPREIFDRQPNTTV